MRRNAATEASEGGDDVTALREERELLERRLEEAHIHLSDIKSSWSGKIASLETQVRNVGWNVSMRDVELF